jgi:DNA-binding beta-propeller fold protein YncE
MAQDRRRLQALLGMAFALALGGSIGPALAQADHNSFPDPYRLVENWAKLPEGRKFGQVIGVRVARDGKSIWAFERCGARSCAGSPLDPILEFDAAGNLKRHFGAGMFVFPHGLMIDRHGDIWATDADAKDGKGDQVFKFSPDGKVLMTLGKKGVGGEGPDTFDKPTAVVLAPNGTIFVADGHGNNRIVKLSPKGKFITAWGKKGTGPGEFDTPHDIAMDSQGRLFVADRGNSRLQLFDQNGKFLAEWRQFGRPSGVFIDKKDVIYVADSESAPSINPGFKRGIRIGNAKDGTVAEFIPDPTANPPDAAGRGSGTGAEGVTADAAGNVYGGETTAFALRKYAKQ